MNNVLVSVWIPSLHCHYDVFFPLTLPIGQVCQLFGNLLRDVTDGAYVSGGQPLLSSLDQKLVFAEERCLADYSVENGEQLMFC